MTTRELEVAIGLGASAFGVIAQITPPIEAAAEPTLKIAQSLAELSPSAILGVFCYMLWKRYTTREDKLSELQDRNIAALQRVADVLERHEQRQ